MQVIGVDPGDLRSSAAAFAKESGVTFPIGLDADSSVMGQQYDFLGPPYAVFIRGDGQIEDIVPSIMTPQRFLEEERLLLR